ncbi:MAG: phosphate/phosphite/phosphonate ABC transporter substrate-binding protein [Candidatus Omnitrophica bacterium]|nr:phosphate/phosphite/phosphonate ABC transporter substrate-binding protein [Candidatus Omnitrophota bacterium]
MCRSKKKVLLLILIFYVLAMPAAVFGADKLVIAIQPTSTPEQLNAQAKELESFLEQRLKADVEVLFPTSYAGVIEALRFGHAQAAFMGSWPAVMAKQRAGAQVLLAEVRDVIIGAEKTEKPYYFSYWVVTKDSPFRTLTDLKGKRAAFPSPLSSSGYLAPLSKLVNDDLVSRAAGEADPKTYFGEVVFAGGYAQAWEALKAGQVDVSVIAGDVPEKLYREVLANTKVIAQQGPIPSHVVVVHKDLDPVVKETLKNALLELNGPSYRELMRKFVSGIFVRFEPADTAHLRSLERMLEQTGFEFKEKSAK